MVSRLYRLEQRDLFKHDEIPNDVQFGTRINETLLMYRLETTQEPAMYEIVTLPREYSREEDHRRVCERFRDLRLASLKLDPQAFANKYEDESNFNFERWERRIGNRNATTFIAVEPWTSSRDLEDVARPIYFNGTWVGMVTSVLTSDSAVSLDAMFVMPEARGRGIGAALVKNLMGHLERPNQSFKQRISTRVASENMVAVKLYQKCGFGIIGEEEGILVLEANTGSSVIDIMAAQ